MTNAIDFARSAFGGVEWPAVPAGPGATMLAVQFQLQQSQWWTPAQLEAAQLRQLDVLLQHAHESMPFWRARLRAAGYAPGAPRTREWFSTVPVLTRRDAQSCGDALRCSAIPAAHGRAYASETSGSTGAPLTYHGTELVQFFWRAFTLREHLWHRRDFSGTLAAIRPKVDDAEGEGWGPATDAAFRTGRRAGFNIRHSLDDQLAFLARVEPQYLISNAYNLCELARRSLETGVGPTRLRGARPYGGTLPEDGRDVVRRAWNAPVTDIYTAEEVGYIALQCPDHEQYHVQSENLIVELLRDDGTTCDPGEIGKVVVTTLHNFAMPLVRYDLGDYAEAGALCACGRGLPVLRRILGRQRNIMTLPDGTRRWPSFASSYWSHLAPIRQLQLVQRSRTRIDIRAVAERPLLAQEKSNLINALQKCLGHPFDMDIEELAAIPRNASYKFEDFVSEIAA